MYRLAPGQKAKIYQEPRTDNKFEGIAELILPLGPVDNDSEDYQWWEVQFCNEHGEFEKVHRAICERHVNQAVHEIFKAFPS